MDIVFLEILFVLKIMTFIKRLGEKEFKINYSNNLLSIFCIVGLSLKGFI